jgi:outer membrane receptor protein involved in Fe transport
LQLSHTFKPADAHTLTWGIDNRVDILDASNADPFMLSKSFVATDIIGLYLQGEWRFAPKWMFSLGGRIDYEFYGGDRSERWTHDVGEWTMEMFVDKSPYRFL